MSQILTDQDFANAKRDISDIDKAVNTESIVDPRWGGDFKSLPMVSKEWEAKTQDAQNTINSWQEAITQITVNDGVPALAVSTANGSNQQAVNDLGGVDYWAARAYQTNNEVRLDDGTIVISTIDNNSNNPNSNMTGWKKKNSADQIFDESGKTQQEVNDDIKKISYANYPDARTLNIFADGTDQTTAIVSMLSDLAAQGVRETIYIPKGVKFNAGTVFANVPLGIVLKISDFTNWGQSSYKNKFEVLFGGDTTADDMQFVVGSGHHAATTLLNTGTAGSVSANERLCSILHSVGISPTGDPLTAQMMQFRKHNTLDMWTWTLRALIPYKIAMANPAVWVSGKSYEVGDMCLATTSPYYVYIAKTSGTSGSTAPSGTGTGINDGGVIWDFYATSRSLDTTRFQLDENGNLQIAGNGDEVAFTVFNGANRGRFYVNSAGDVVLQDYSKSRAMLQSSTARGVFTPSMTSLYFANLSGATPTLSSNAATITNATATNMTNMLLATGLTHGEVTLHFRDANTTLVNSGSLNLKGGVNVTPPVNGFMKFIRNGSIGSGWYEVSRSF